MSTVHKFKGNEDQFRWEGVESLPRVMEGLKGATKSVLIGDDEGAPHFIMRFFSLAPGGHSRQERHPHEHEVIILQGKGVVQLGEVKHEVEPFDVVFVEGNGLHQFSNPNNEPFGFICVIPRLD